MTDPVKRPAPIQWRYRREWPLARPIVARIHSGFVVCWGEDGVKWFRSFADAISFAHDDREIGACS